MKKIIICLLSFFWLTVAQAYGMDALAYFNLGISSDITYKKIDYFTKALELNPKMALAYAKRGMLYYFQEKYDDVIRDFEEYTRFEPKEADAYRMLGMAYLKKEKYEDAVHNFTTAIKRDPNHTGAYTYRAEAYRLSYKYDKALADANQAIRLWGDLRTLSDAFRTRAKVYEEMGQDQLANADFKKSIDLDPRFVFIKYFSNYASPEDMRRAGLLGMICIAFVMVFGLKLNRPDKDK